MVKKALRRHVEADSCIGASDSGQALKHGFKRAGIPAAHARHHLDEMTPLVSIPKWKLSDKQTKTLKDAAKSSRGGKKAALEMKTVFQIVGGDNATESEVNRTKSQLRRTNALGRGSPANAHVDQLSARRLLRQPGLLNVLNAIGNVRNKVKLALGHEPKDFLVLDKNSSWLFE